ncbi:hypothetical protein Tco_1331743 [Tanacetum coccineum]
MVTMEFAVVKSHSPYNVLLGRTDLRSLEGAASTIHLMIKFPTNNEIATMTTKRETLQEYRRIEEAQGLVSDIQQKGQKTEKNKQNQAREWKEYEKSKPKAYTSLMGQPEPILLGQSKITRVKSSLSHALSYASRSLTFDARSDIFWQATLAILHVLIGRWMWHIIQGLQMIAWGLDKIRRIGLKAYTLTGFWILHLSTILEDLVTHKYGV